MMKNYIIPYGERFVFVGKGMELTLRYITLMCVDNLGVVVKHPKGYKPTEDDVRSNLIGWNEQKEVIIQADSLQEALQKFYDFPECKIGTKHRAWELVNSEHKPVIEYIGCKHMYLKNWIGCTRYDEPDEPRDGGGMVCILDGLDEPPHDCPIEEQMKKIVWREEITMIGGVWVKQYTKNVKPMDEQINGIIPKKVAV